MLGILIPIEEMMCPDLPRLVETALLPFRGKIIYDENLLSFNVLFGTGMRKNIIDSFNQAKTNFGVITYLPVSNREARANDSDVLRGFLKTEYSRNVHHDEIQDLINKIWPHLYTNLIENHRSEVKQLDGVTGRQKTDPAFS